MRVALGYLAVIALSACGRLGFDLQPADSYDAPAGDDSPADDATDGPPAYRAVPVRFDPAGGDYMYTGFLANTVDSPRGTLSAWFHFNGGDGQQQYIAVAQVIAAGGVFREANNTIRFVLFTCGGIPLLDMATQNPHTSSEGWIHLLASWDLSISRAQIYINDVVDRGNPAILSGNVCYASIKWGIGGLNSNVLDADVADFYALLGTSLDLDMVANRRKFIDAAGKPVPLGTTCMMPSGTAVTGCFELDAATWNMNRGAGAGFTLQGDGLTEASSSPSD